MCEKKDTNWLQTASSIFVTCVSHLLKVLILGQVLNQKHDHSEQGLQLCLQEYHIAHLLEDVRLSLSK